MLRIWLRIWYLKFSVEYDILDYTLEYVLEYKKIPFDVSEYLQEQNITHFSPVETSCYKCDSDLEILKSVNNGFIFTIFKKVSNISEKTSNFDEHVESRQHVDNMSVILLFIKHCDLREINPVNQIKDDEG